MSAQLSPQLRSRMHQTHVMARVLVQAAPNTPNSVPLRCFCLLPIRYGEKRQETRESRVYCGRDTAPTHTAKCSQDRNLMPLYYTGYSCGYSTLTPL